MREFGHCLRQGLGDSKEFRSIDQIRGPEIYGVPYRTGRGYTHTWPQIPILELRT